MMISFIFQKDYFGWAPYHRVSVTYHFSKILCTTKLFPKKRSSKTKGCLKIIEFKCSYLVFNSPLYCVIAACANLSSKDCKNRKCNNFPHIISSAPIDRADLIDINYYKNLPSSAESIKAIVSSIPYKAIKPPNLGPWDAPSNIS